MRRPGIPLAILTVGLAACSLIFPTSGLRDGTGEELDGSSDDAGDGGLCDDGADHCGACDVVCKQTTCAANMCKPFVAGNEVGDADNTVTVGAFQYWLTPSAGDSSVTRIALDDLAKGRPVEVVASHLLGASLLATNGSDLFFQADHAVYRLAAAPSAPSAAVVASVANNETLYAFAVTKSVVYTLARRSGAAGVVTVARTGLVEADGSAPAATTVFSLPSSEGAPGSLVESQGDLFFFSDASTPNGTLYRVVGADGDAPTGQQLTASDQKRPGRIAVDGNEIYWAEDGIFRAKRDGSARVRVVGHGAGEVLSSVALDPTYVFFTVRTTGVVRRALRTGSAASNLARMDTLDAVVAVAGPYVVWTADGRLRALLR